MLCYISKYCSFRQTKFIKMTFFCFRVQCNMESGSGLVFTFDYNQIDAGSNSNRRQCIFALRHSHHQTLILEKKYSSIKSLCVQRMQKLDRSIHVAFFMEIKYTIFHEKEYCLLHCYITFLLDRKRFFLFPCEKDLFFVVDFLSNAPIILSESFNLIRIANAKQYTSINVYRRFIFIFSIKLHSFQSRITFYCFLLSIRT